jgi:hypothetical protein
MVWIFTERNVLMKALICTIILFLAVPCWATTYYLDIAANGASDSNNGLTTGAPWLTPNHAVNCGDVILAAASSSYAASNFANGKWGTVTCAGNNDVAWLKCATFDTCIIGASGSPYKAMDVTASYWGIQGWEANNAATATVACFTVEPLYAGSIAVHHVIFANNVANSCRTGFAAQNHSETLGIDYLVWIGNIAYNGTASAEGAGFDVYQPIATDSVPGTHLYWAGNFAWANEDNTAYDGEGWNIDTLDGSQGSLPSAYNQQVVIDNNISIFNGAAGIWGSAGGGNTSAPVYIRHNTTYGNNMDSSQSNADCGEILFATSPNATSYTQAFLNLAMTSAASGGACGSGNPMYVLTVSNTNSTDAMYQNFGYSAAGHNTFKYATSTTFTFDPSNQFGANPNFANPVEPGAPSCSSYANVPACMATVIADFTPGNAAAASFGYQAPSGTPDYDPLFPQWLCSVTNLPSGLVTMGCAASVPNVSGATLSGGTIQ